MTGLGVKDAVRRRGHAPAALLLMMDPGRLTRSRHRARRWRSISNPTFLGADKYAGRRSNLLEDPLRQQPPGLDGCPDHRSPAGRRLGRVVSTR